MGKMRVSPRLRFDIGLWRDVVKASNAEGSYPEAYVRQAIMEKLLREPQALQTKTP